jgi:TolB protein
MFPRGLAILAALAPLSLAAQNVAEVQVAPPSITLRVGERAGLLATAFDRIGNVIPTARMVWSSNNVQIARVDNNGTVTGVAAGVAIIEARSGTRRGQAAVQVTGGGAPAPSQPPPSQTGTPANPAQTSPLVRPGAADPYVGQPAGTGVAAALRIEPPSIYLLPSEHVRVTPRALKEDGTAAAPVPVAWRSLTPDVASLDESGNVVALKEGQGTIQVNAAGGLTATAPVIVQQTALDIHERGPLTLSPGQSLPLHVVVPAQNNRQVSPLLLQWSSSNPEVARVNLAGVLTAVGPGRATIGVTGLLQTKGIEVNVHRPVELLTVTPSSQREIQLPLLGSQRFEVRALATDNTPVPEAPIGWRLTDSSVASLDRATGTVTGRAIGRTQLVVTGPGSGLSATWTINVVAGNVKLAATRLGLAPGRRFTLRASFADSAGAVIAPATGLAWTSSAPAVATVAEDGTVTAVQYGRARVTATAPGGKTAAADVFVQGEIVVASNRSGKRSELYALERANLAAWRKVSSDTSPAQEPAISPDGSRIAFVSTRDGNAEIYVMNVDGTEWKRLTADPAPDGAPVFTADGQAVVFHSARGPSKRHQLFSVNVDGTGLRQLTQDSVNTHATVSPDGQTIAYLSTRSRDADVWLMARDGSNQRAFTRSPQWRESSPRFLRDGSLAYLVERREGNRTITQVMKADLATGQTTALTGTDAFIAAFAVAPAGDLIALVQPPPGKERDRNPNYRVFLRPLGSGTPLAIPSGEREQVTGPAFLP